MKNKAIQTLILCLLICLGFVITARAEAVADTTGLIPIISWDFDSQPNASNLKTTNKGSVTLSFKNEGSTSYVEEFETGTYAMNTASFTPYTENAVSVPPKTGLTLSMYATLGTKANGITLNYRSGAGDVVIRRGTTAGSLLIGFGPEMSASTHYMEATIPDGDTEYHLYNLVVEETGMSLYVDGILTTSTTEFTAWHSSKIFTVMQFGSHYNGPKGSEVKGGGYIGDLRFYDEALTLEQIETLKNEFDINTKMFFTGFSNPKIVDVNFSVDYSFSIYGDNTANVYVVYDTDSTFTNPITNQIGFAIGNGTHSLELSNLEFNTTYYYYLLATNGDAQSESVVSSFATEQQLNPSSYLKRIEVTVPGYTGTTSLKNFPILVALSEETVDGFRYNEILDGGADIFFTKENNTIVPHEIESWDVEGTSYVWVRVPELTSNGATLFLYYGAINQEALMDVNPEYVWVEYAAVFHGGETIVDATGNANNVVANNVTSATTNGIVGGVMTKPASQTGIQFSNPVTSGALSTIAEVSVSGWFKKTNSSTGIILGNKNDWNGAGFLALVEKGTWFSVAPNGSHQGDSEKGGLTLNEWGHLAFSYDNTSLRSYHNGSQIYEKDSAVALSDSSQTYWAFGSYTAKGNDSIGGDMDELRIYNGVASSDWIKAEYDSVSNPASFVALSSVADINSGIPSLTTPTVIFNADGTVTISVAVYDAKPNYVQCKVGGKTFVMTTEDTEPPMTYSTIVSDIPAGSYIAIVEVGTDAVVVDKVSAIFYMGALNVDAISDADEGTMIPGYFRVSRAETDTNLFEIDVICSFSGDGMSGTTLSDSIAVTIPEGVEYVDIPIQPKYSAEIDEDTTVVVTVTGEMVCFSSTASMTVKNVVDNVWVRYVSPTGDDANRGVSPDAPKLTISSAVECLIPYVENDIGTVYVADGHYPNPSQIYLTNAIHIIGLSNDPSAVVVSNTVRRGWNNQNQRVFYVNNKDVFISGVTMQAGGVNNQKSGGNLFIGTAGGVVSNCVIEAGSTELNSYAAGARVEGGLLTHTILRNNRSDCGSGSWQGSFRGGTLEVCNSGIVENCLLEENNQSVNVALIHLYGSSIMRNCTIVNSSLSSTNEHCSVFTPLQIDSKATAQNIVIAGVTNTIDGAVCLPTGTVASFINGAVDGDITGLGFPENTIVGTGSKFFANYAEGDYRPKTSGPLINKGLNYENMPEFDLSGTQKRLIRDNVDIGCYEGYTSGMSFLVY